MIVRIQYRRALINAPSFGKWNVYSNAWFESSTAVLSAPVLGLIQRLFTGAPPTGAATNWIIGTDHFNRSAGAARITCWSHSAGVLTNEGEYPVTVPTGAGGQSVNIPSQSAIAIGYRSEVGGPVQRGRSRFWLGPLSYSGQTINFLAGQGMFLTAGAQTILADNVLGTVLALQTAGFDLNVKTGVGAGATFSPAVEIYVDNILDVMRSRRAWFTGQQRRTIA